MNKILNKKYVFINDPMSMYIKRFKLYDPQLYNLYIY